MPVVKANKRILYDGLSLEDAKLVADVAREMVVYQKLHFNPRGGSSIPKGACGAALDRENSRQKREVVEEALSVYRRLMQRVSPGRAYRQNDGPAPVPPARVVRN